MAKAYSGVRWDLSRPLTGIQNRTWWSADPCKIALADFSHKAGLWRGESSGGGR
jgi:hypothetical protein